MRAIDAQDIRRGILMAKGTIKAQGNHLPRYHSQTMRSVNMLVPPATFDAYARLIEREVKKIRAKRREQHRQGIIQKINGDMDGE